MYLKHCVLHNSEEYGRLKYSIITGNFLDCKSRFVQNESVDLTVTSPPYNLDMEYDSISDKNSYESYLEFSRKYLSEIYLLSKENGRLCLNIALDKNKNGIRPIYSDVLGIAKQCGWKYHTTIIWNEQNISRRTAWGSFRSPTAPYIICPVETIIVMYKGDSWKIKKQSQQIIDKEDFINWTNGLWTFPGERARKKIGHPAPFPIELPNRCIKLFTFPGDLVLDPFLGSGTTMLSAYNLDRSCVGFDISENYCGISHSRLLKEMNKNDHT